MPTRDNVWEQRRERRDATQRQNREQRPDQPIGDMPAGRRQGGVEQPSRESSSAGPWTDRIPGGRRARMIGQELAQVPETFRQEGGGTRGFGAAARQAGYAMSTGLREDAALLRRAGPQAVDFAEGIAGSERGALHSAMGSQPPSRTATQDQWRDYITQPVGTQPRGAPSSDQIVQDPSRISATGGVRGSADPFGAGRSAERMMGVSQAQRQRGDQNYIEGADGRRMTLNDLQGRQPNVMSSEAMMRPSTAATGALSEAQRAAAARGDWRALERTGAIQQRGDRRGGGAPGGGQGIQSPRAMELMERAQDMFGQAGRSSDPNTRSRNMRAAREMSAMAQNMLQAEAGVQRQGMQSATQLQRDEMAADAARETAQMEAQAPPSELDQARTENERAQAMQRMTDAARTQQQMGQRPDFNPDIAEALGNSGHQDAQRLYVMGSLRGVQMDTIENELSRLGADLTSLPGALEDLEAGNLDPQTPLGQALQGFQQMSEMESFAEGGLVPDEAPMSAMGMAGTMEGSMGPMSGAMGGAGAPMMQAMGQPAPMDSMQLEYEQYAQGAESMGLPAIPFEQFLELRQARIPEAPDAPGATQPFAAEGFAMGGLVPDEAPGLSAMHMGQGPDVSGAMVVDPDPNAPTDSIPALIDGERPAAIDSGEFIVPDDVVRFHGLQKLQKLIEQARQGEDGSHGSIAGAAGSY